MVIYGDRVIWRWLRTVFFAMALWAGWSSPGFAQQVIPYNETVDGSIPTSNTSPCPVPTERKFTVPENYTIDDVNIGVLINTLRRSSLQLSLTSPAGTTRTLIVALGGVRANLNVLFDSAQPASVSSHSVLNDTALSTTVVPPYQRSFAPLDSLNNFNGQNANGVWTLKMCNVNFTGTPATFLHATLFITPRPVTLVVTKTSTVLTDVVSATNPKSIPGARVRYCITVFNKGPGLATTISGSDIIPANTIYLANSMRSGPNCDTTLTAEDDDAVGADETDPIGASVNGNILSITAPTMASSVKFSLAFDVTVN